MKQIPLFPSNRRAQLLSTLCLAVLLAACSGAPREHQLSDLLTPAPIPEGAVESQLPVSMPDVAHGKAIYAAKCFDCHGETGQGDGPKSAQIRAQGGQVAKLNGSILSRNATPAEWFDVITNGRINKLMPGFSQSLPSQNRWDVLSYVWAMALDTPSMQLAQNTYATQCLTCHGAAGKGDGPDAGSAKLQSFADAQWSTSLSLDELSTAMISGTVHSAMKLDDTQRLTLASYVRSMIYNYADPGVVASAPTTGDGRLSLLAVNGTPGGGSVVGLPVVMHAYNSSGEVFSRTAAIDQAGMAYFDGLPRDPSLFYQADATYSGARFFAPPMQFSGTQQLSNTLPLFEVTNDPSVITVSEYHFFVQDVGEGFINVVEFYAFDNLSNRAYINRQSTDNAIRSVRIAVPADATDISFDGPGLGVRYFQDGQTITDSDAVPPGQQSASIVMMYNLPYQGGRAFSVDVAYPVKNWDVLLPDNELRVADMKDTGVQPFHTSTIRIYQPEQPGLIAGGGKIAFKVTGQPRAVPVPGQDNNALLIGAIVFVLTAVTAGFAVFARTRRR